MSTNATTRWETDPDTRSKLDSPKSTSNSTDLDASDVVNTSGADRPAHSESADHALATGSNLTTLSISIHHANINKETCGSNLQIYFNIEEELSKGKSSTIKVDHESSEQTDVTRLTPRSVDQGAKQKYGISILEDHEQHASPENVQEQPAIQENEEDVGPNGGLSKTKANNLLTTFALLVEDIAKSAPKYRIKGEPNVSKIAEYIDELATNVDTGEKLSGVGNESIKSWIEAAREAKKEKLDQK